MSRRWLVAVSVVAHLAVGVGLVASGVWEIERVEAGRRTVDLGRPLAPPEPAPGGPVAVESPEIVPKPKTVTKDRVQPVTNPPPEVKPVTGGGEDPGAGAGSGGATATGKCLENCGDAPPAPPVCGDRTREAGEQCDDGNTTSGDGCSATCAREVIPERESNIAPRVLQGLRISGETQVHPDAATQNMMLRNQAGKVVGSVKVCLATDGRVASATLMQSTAYAGYDAALLSAVRGWRYQPYTVNGVAVRACSVVTFVYSIRSR